LKTFAFCDCKTRLKNEEEQMHGRTLNVVPIATKRNLVAAGVLAMFCFCLMTIATVHAQAPAGSLTMKGSWTLKAPLPGARGEVAAVALDGKLRALGGSVDGKAGPYDDEYDPATNTWRGRAPLPEGRDHLAVAVADGKIFAFGGFTSAVHKGAGTDAFE
jgi:hypothetical protein